jgi:NADH-quinone oxidoreductase subunit H
MAVTQNQNPQENKLRPYINLILLLVAGGVITAGALGLALLIASNTLTGSVWVALAGALGAVYGFLSLTVQNRMWARIPGVLAIIFGVVSALGAFSFIITGISPIVAGLLAVLAVVLGIVSLIPSMRRSQIFVGLAVLGAIIAALALISILGSLWAFIVGAGTDVLTWLFNPNRVATTGEVIQCRADAGCSTTQAVIYSALFLFTIVTGFAYTTLLERKFIAWFQHRSGPNRVGPGGLLQPAADGVKLVFKEDITPSGADLPVYLIAPILKTLPTLLLLAVVPLGPDLIIPWFDGRVYQVPLGLIDVNVGVLWLLAITSIGTYGVVLAGWASNNKYSMLGGLRASAQMLSYELSLGLTMAVPILIVGSMSLGDIIRQQTYIWEWFIFQNPLAAGILFIALLAEINRSPFDLPEAEQELTQGYMTEYSGMKFALFMMAEYLGMIGISAVVISLYLGGYQDGFGIVNSLPILGPLVFIGKIVLFLIFMVWIRATLPRIRYDRLMALGWKIMLPLALVAVAWSAVSVLIGESANSTLLYAVLSGIFFVAVVAIGLGLLSRSGETVTDREDPVTEDPVITGERRGLGYTALQVLGGIIGIPFALYNFTLKVLDNIANLSPEDDEPKSDDNQTKLPAKTSGGD